LQKRPEGLNDRFVKVDLPETISAVQKTLGVEVDGTAGPETWNAIYIEFVA
jgi:peptidoglycan hydrolase-like protein with peptidoglycan-binding domain